MQKCVVLTDCEPDDELALGVLRLRDFHCTYLVVGEGNPDCKVVRGLEYVRELGWTHAEVVPGIGSTKPFPGEDKAPAATSTFSVAGFLTALEAVPLLVCLKPPREVLAALEEAPDRARAVFRTVTLAIYGSFNLRCIGYRETVPLVTYETSPFARVYCYESHGNSVPNLNPDTAPLIRDWMAVELPAFARRVLATCRLWNEDIIRDCDESCAEEEAKQRAEGLTEPTQRWIRNDKCRQAVKAFPDCQFVPADPILALLLNNPRFPPLPMTMAYEGKSENEYPVMTVITSPSAQRGLPVPTSFTWKGLQGPEIITALDDLLA